MTQTARNITISFKILLKIGIFLYNFANLFFTNAQKMYGQTTNFVCIQ